MISSIRFCHEKIDPIARYFESSCFVFGQCPSGSVSIAVSVQTWPDVQERAMAYVPGSQ